MNTEEVSFNDVHLFFIYTFNFKDELDAENVGRNLFAKGIAKAFLNEKKSEIAVGESEKTALYEFRRYDQRYFHPEYLSLGRFVRLELPGFRIFYPTDQEVPVKVYLSIHSVGVGSLLLWIAGIPSLKTRELVRLEISTENEIEVVLPDVVLSSALTMAGKKLSKQTRLLSTLNQIFEYYLITLADKGGLLIEGYNASARKFASLDFNSYLVTFVLDISPPYSTPDEFIKAHKKHIIDVLETRSYYEDLVYHETRKDAYISSVISASNVSRKHVCYFITPERMLHISTVKRHIHMYPYESSEWFLHETAVVEILRVQYQLLSYFNKILYLWTKADPLELTRLRKRIQKGLEEYHIVRFPKYYLTRRFVGRLRAGMELDPLFEEVERKLDMISESITVIHNIESEKRAEATKHAVDILTLIISGPVAFELVDKFIKVAEIWMYMVAWLGMAIVFYVIEKLLISLYLRKYSREI